MILLSRHRLRSVCIAIFLMVSICAGLSAADYRDGITALHRGDYASAVTVFRLLAEQGDARAQNALAYLYQRGLGVSKDEELAEHWRQRAITSLVGDGEQSRSPDRSPSPNTTPSRATSTGSGFLVDRRGSVLTNHHVVQECKTLRAGSAEIVARARIVRTDPASDLALLRLDLPFDLDPATFRSQQAAVLGEPVLIAGYPLQGLLSSEVQVASGIVSALAGPHGSRRLLQNRAPIVDHSPFWSVEFSGDRRKLPWLQLRRVRVHRMRREKR